MNLHCVQDWPAEAAAARYHPGRLATRLEVSLRTLERFLLRTRGQTPSQWLEPLRDAAACRLLREGRLRIKEIADVLGYEDVSAFGRAFKQRHLLPPTLYALLNGGPGTALGNWLLPVWLGGWEALCEAAELALEVGSAAGGVIF